MMNIYDKLIGKRDHKDRDEKDSEEGITFDNFCYLKVSEGAVREYSLAYGAKEKGGMSLHFSLFFCLKYSFFFFTAFPNVESHDDLTTLLRFHFMCEAIQLNVSKLSILAATLARFLIHCILSNSLFLFLPTAQRRNQSFDKEACFQFGNCTALSFCVIFVWFKGLNRQFCI